MRRIYLFLFLILASPAVSLAQSDTLKVITWNLEWWADGSTHNAATQVSKTQQLLNTFNADFYGFQEIVNADSFRNMAGRLSNGPWATIVSTWGSMADNPASPSYPSAQKLGFMYRPSQFRNVSFRAFTKDFPYSYGDFASGRYPMLVSGDLLCSNGSWMPVNFIVLHAKAMTDDRSCTRRLEGAEIMKDSLDRNFANRKVLMMGDFNDDLDTSICSTTRISAYSNFVNDSAIAPYYKCLTLPISRLGERSSDNYSSLIDHFIANNSFAPIYINGTAKSLRSLVNSTVTQYSSTVSDHYPVQVMLRRPASSTLAVDEAVAQSSLNIFPNPCREKIIFHSPVAVGSYRIVDVYGKAVAEGRFQSPEVRVETASLASGMYLLQVSNDAQLPVVNALFLKQ